MGVLPGSGAGDGRTHCRRLPFPRDSPDSAIAGEGRHTDEDEDENKEQYEDGVEQQQDEAALSEAIVPQGLVNDLLLCTVTGRGRRRTMWTMLQSGGEDDGVNSVNPAAREARCTPRV